jgi:predicted HD phosphohydrolase
MALSQSERKTQWLIGIGLYSPDYDEVVSTARAALHDRNPWVAAAALHNIGHLPRRFGHIDWVLVRHAKAVACSRLYQAPVRHAFSDMVDDVENFVPFKVRMREAQYAADMSPD